ncbi:MAG TPA: sulfotransferase, partial [Thermohalobaculum sp.]|nr:sulfotransferase [Thermohalobaculum sp.]
FVSGVQRSGTTALGELLNAHPRIALGIERYKFVYGRAPDEVGPRLFEAGRFFDVKETETNLRAPSHYLRLRRKFDAATLVGDKLPGLQHRLPLLAERFPGARVLFLVRDPAAVAASWQQRAGDRQDHWPAENGAERAVAEWNRSMRAVCDWRSDRLRLIPVSFEGLFSGSLLHLRRLLAAIGVDETPEILRAFAEATAGWADRAARRPRLTEAEAGHVLEHARVELMDMLEEQAGGRAPAVRAGAHGPAARIEPGTYDFADFGCSNGKSIAEARKQFGGTRGIGIDISAEKVRSARAGGFEVMQGDLTRLEVPDRAFRFVTMSHFLEHLPSPALAARCIETAVRTSREFVFIRQPWFATDGYLATLGLKQYWSDWRGHTNRMDPLDFYLAFRDLPEAWRWRVYGRYRIADSGHESLIPIGAPTNQHQYDPARHGPKPEARFDRPVYKETVALLCGPGVDFHAVEKRLSYVEPLVTSDALSESEALRTGLADLSAGVTAFAADVEAFVAELDAFLRESGPGSRQASSG